MFDPTLFDRGADVRGEYPRQINEELAWFVGRYLARFLQKEGHAKPGIVVGRDGRKSSPAIYAALVQGIAAEGAVPIPAGLATTDMVLWGAGEGLGGAVAGAMVTASHNPPQYNGIKAAMRGPAGLETIRPVVHLKPIFEADCRSDASVQTAPAPAAPFPVSARLDLPVKFVAAACRQAPSKAQFRDRIVLDPGNGVGSVVIPAMKQEIPHVEIESIFAEIDGNFPNRPSNPGLPGATAELQRMVRERGASFGAAFDGDADRVFLVDELGRFVPGDQVLATLVRVMLAREAANAAPADKPWNVVFAGTCSWLLVETIRKQGGEPIICKVGQESIKAAMAALGAVFGGEASAHYNFPESYLLDSGLTALMTFWQAVHSEGKTVSEMTGELSAWPQSGEINVRIESDDWKRISGETIDRLQGEHESAKDCYVLDIDGISVYYPYCSAIPDAQSLFRPLPGPLAGEPYRSISPDYSPDRWFSLRRSNNEPLIRLNAECRDAAELEPWTRSLLDKVMSACREIGNCPTKVVDWGYLGSGGS